MIPPASSCAKFGSPTPPPPVFRSTEDLQKLISPKFLSTHARLRPVPTNEWWGNLLAWDGQRDSDPVFSGPYTYKVVPSQPGTIGSGLSVSYLVQYRMDGPLNDNGAPRFYCHQATIKNWIFSSVELARQSSAIPPLSIEAWDDMGVHLSMSGMKMYLSLGSAYTTVEYRDVQVQLGTEHCIVAINGAPVRENSEVNGVSFVISLNNGQLWVLYFFADASKNTSLVFKSNKLTTACKFTGVVQAAFVSTSAVPSSIPQNDHKILQVYHASAGIYPRGAFVETLSSESFSFRWQLVQASGSNPGAQFLHFALTHLHAMLDKTTVELKPELVLHSHTHGPLFAYMLITSTNSNSMWICHVSQAESQAVETCTSFYPPRAGCLTRDMVDRLKLCRIVTDEIYEDWCLPNEGSYYFKGKALQKFGTMCLVARQLADTTNPEMQHVAQHGISKLVQLMSQFANNQSAFPLVYDTVYKGIISSEALARNDINVDFGNGVYNDHHYHYGYIVTAAAMTLYLDPHWRHSADAAKLRSIVDTLIRDVATSSPGDSDPYFPRFRYFNWWLGHSYSHGVTPMADGKDEESTSEEVNFLYGFALYGQVTEDQEQQRLAKLMLKVYVHAVNTYFLLRNDGPVIHPAGFARNKVTGVFFDNKCDYTTWFSPNKECIHGIQMIPVSPILEVSRAPQFVREEWDEVLHKLPIVHDWKANQSSWTSLLFTNYSVLDREKAFKVLKKCPMDDGLSRAWALYYAATRPPPFC
ncbi:endo--beta [Plasmopara halstedii]|uniref:glucan endo-1,3-beta-D-glucosidase n=1 Tax=Plasmopara halstedii TaxID=4781 RepID=A0A0P1B2L6_PLAHL|nr:endo--beta [Plasmopara halstedii]CEG47585.1 endo--beta [Plasmopara halstedii]|eukprot:XP_024583954.1 endo--beta [Plasmopara halstedii]